MLHLATEVLLLLLLLLLPLSFSDDIQIVLYEEDNCLGTQFEAIFNDVSKVRCSAVCLQMKSSCTGFCFNKSSGDCQLFSLVDDSNPLQLLQAPGVNLYVDKSKEGILRDKPQFLSSDTAVTFSGARAFCSSYGASVYVPQNLLQIPLSIPLGFMPFVWVGLTDEQIEGIFRDVNTGAPAIFLPWIFGEPNGHTSENCVGMSSIGFLVDIDCNTLLPVLCVKKLSGSVVFEFG